jgi:hypothetical protein
MNVRIEYPARFLAGIYYQGRLQMNEYTVKIYMMTATTNTDDHNIALNRMKYFIYNKLESGIFIDQKDAEQCQKFIAAGLNVITIPGDPVDQLIGIMLYSKLTAIAEGKLTIGEVEISSFMSDGIVYLHGENENVADVEFPNWWTTNDLVNCENNLLGDSKILSIQNKNVWRELELEWCDSEEEVSPVDTGNTLVFADFKKFDDTK